MKKILLFSSLFALQAGIISAAGLTKFDGQPTLEQVKAAIPSEGTAILMIHDTTCPHSKKLLDWYMGDFSKKYPAIKVIKLDKNQVEQKNLWEEITAKYRRISSGDIQQLPVSYIFHKGSVITDGKFTGDISAAIEDKIKKHTEKHALNFKHKTKQSPLTRLAKRKLKK